MNWYDDFKESQGYPGRLVDPSIVYVSVCVCGTPEGRFVFFRTTTKMTGQPTDVAGSKCK
jgi:hypothetical protein